MGAWSALAGVGVALLTLGFVELWDRFDRWSRSVGIPMLVPASRGYWVTMKWLCRFVIGAFGLFFLVLFFTRL